MNATLPEAIVADRRFPWLALLLPIAAVALGLVLLRETRAAKGPEIQLHFEQGHGIQAGDPVRMRGINIGEVHAVRLAQEESGVVLDVRLAPESAAIARTGTAFWIARVKVGASGVSGLDTLVGPRYIAAIPGPADSPPQLRFTGLENAPADPPWRNGLEVVLESPSRGGVGVGAPILYRGLSVGRIVSVGLAGDATAVLLRASIDPDYAELVRDGTRFWEATGLELSVGLLTGLKLEFETLEGLIAGAASFATPADGGAAARTDERYQLHSRPEEAWLAWSPNLPVGSSLLPPGAARPEPRRIALTWKEKQLFGLSSSSERRLGWGLRVSDGLLAPAAVLYAPEEAREGTAALEIGGERLGPLAPPDGGLPYPAPLIAKLPLPADPGAWSAERISRATSIEPVLVFGDPGQGARAIDAARLTPLDSGSAASAWRVQGNSFSWSWNGAAVLSRETGDLIGLLIVDKAGVRVALLSE